MTTTSQLDSTGLDVGAALRRDGSTESRHKAAPTVCRPARPRRAASSRRSLGVGGFTLLELLTVIAIIGILAALIFPSVTGARRAANKSKTRVQFSQWAAAIEGFRSEYGYYPAFHSTNLVNGGAGTGTATDHLFHDILAGKRRDGSAPSATVSAQNKKLISFYSFSESDFTDAASPTPNLIHDAFDNTEIAVLVDKNLDGVINAVDYPGGFPLVSGVRPGATDIPATGIRANVIFYAASSISTVASPDFIFSWK